jgi:hypothetical protein
VTTDPGTSAGRVCIALSAEGAYGESAAVLAAVVRELGWEVFVARDGDRSMLAADVVILFGRCSAFGASAKLLGAHATQRPTTVLWHIELLPPGVIPASAEDTARRLARCELSELPRPWLTWVGHVPGHSLFINLARRLLGDRLTARCGWEEWTHAGSVHSREWFHAVQNAVWFKQWYSGAWCDFVAASTQPRCRLLTEMGIACEYAPLGYHPLWGTDQGEDRDIDVLFLGRTRRTGREQLLRRIDRRLARAGVKLMVVDRDCYGENRTRLLNRAKISLDLIKNTWEMPLLRLIVSVACGALVVSNCAQDPYPFRDEHLVRVDSDALAAAILEHLHNEPVRRRMAAAAYHHLTTELAWHPVVARVLRRAVTQRSIHQGVTS